MTQAHGHFLHEFGGFRLDPDRRLLCGSDGAPISLKPKVFDTLLYFVEHQGELLDKSAIMKALWGDVIVEENSLNQHISALRRVLGEAPGENRFIVTVPGRGYRFVAPVTKTSAPAPATVPPQSVARRMLPWLSGVAIVVVGIVTSYALMQGPAPSPAQRVGAVERITRLTSYPGDELWPSLSPDGTRVAFAHDSGGSSRTDIYTLRLGTAGPVRLTQALDGEDRNPAWSPDGASIAFLRLQDPTHLDVMIVPAAGGPERKLVSIRVRPISVDGNPMLAWTPDSQALLVTAAVEGSRKEPVYRLHRLSVGSGALTPLGLPAEDLDYDTSPAVSPDGRRLAFVRYRLSQRLAKLMVQELGPDLAPKGQPYTFPDMMGVPHSPTWSPDGRQLTFVMGQQILQWDGMTTRTVYTMLARSNGPSESRRIGGLTMFWDGSRARAIIASGDVDSDIWALPLDPHTHTAAGSAARRVPSTQLERHPQLSPDGRQLAFISDRSGAPALWIAGRNGESVRMLAQVDSYIVGFPAWSPDGRQIAFHTSAPNQERVIYVVDVDAGVPKRLFNGCCPAGWSRDGQYLYVTDAGNVNSVARVRVTTGERENLFVGELAAESADGRKLLYAKGGSYGIYARSLTGNLAQDDEVRLVDDYTPPLGKILPIADGFFYLGLQRTGQPRAFRFYDYATSTAWDVASAPPSTGLGMSVSPDGRELLYSANANESGADLALLEFAPN